MFVYKGMWTCTDALQSTVRVSLNRRPPLAAATACRRPRPVPRRPAAGCSARSAASGTTGRTWRRRCPATGTWWPPSRRRPTPGGSSQSVPARCCCPGTGWWASTGSAAQSCASGTTCARHPSTRRRRRRPTVSADVRFTDAEAPPPVPDAAVDVELARLRGKLEALAHCVRKLIRSGGCLAEQAKQAGGPLAAAAAAAYALG